MNSNPYIVAALLLSSVMGIAGQQALADTEQTKGSKAMTVVRYEDFGAKGDGQADDFDAIVEAHAYANQHQLPVKANDTATYYIGGKDQQAVIETDTDFGKAKFVIDDRKLENIKANVFVVRSTLEPIALDQVKTLKVDQKKLDVTLPQACLVIVTDKHVRRYIRKGLNQNKGSLQTDVFLVDKKGNIDQDAAIIWDFEQITDIEALPLDGQTLTITGGEFTTIANQAESKYNYHARGIAIRRSNVVVEDIQHRITGEGEHGAPYGGFINIAKCANVTIQNTRLSGHKTYTTIGSAGKPVSMGSYDISCNRAIHVKFVNCSQFNDIMDRSRWGIMGSNFCKNLSFDRCTFSRFDAHQGVYNARISDSTLGYMGINAIGKGTFLLENSTVNGGSLINLRPDYGSTWQGEMTIRNCRFIPGGGRRMTANLISGRNDGQHDFGYTCYMPGRIVIENLHIDDRKHPENYRGPAIFANFNPAFKTKDYKQRFPYVLTKQVVLKNVTTESGKPLRVSDNMVMFADVDVVREPAE